jgi:D-glycero-alpha-D-manno-heptose-7-phosphate kinase
MGSEEADRFRNKYRADRAFGRNCFCHGALGAKVSGAGGGGFMMFIVPPSRRYQVVRALNDAGASAGDVHFTTQGAESWRV